MRCALHWRKVCLILLFLFYNTAWSQATTPIQKNSNAVTIIILVRHAEKEKGDNPPLSEEGKFRALALKEALKSSSISVIYCPDLKRNKQTAQPLAELMNIDLTLISEDLYSQPKKMADHVVSNILEKHAGKAVLYVGNTTKHVKHEGGNLHEMYWRLGGEGFSLTRYQDMYIFIKGPNSMRIIHSLYGNVE